MQKKRLENLNHEINTNTMKENSLLKTIIDVVTCVFLVAGVVIGYLSYEEYKRSNIINQNSTLFTADREIYKPIENKPYLQAFFAQRSLNISAFDGSQKLLKLLLGKNDNISFKWKNIPDLYDKLYQLEGFNQPDRVRMRACFSMAQDILYLLENVYSLSENSEDLKDIDAETWFAYIEQIGGHPLFLAAIYEGHKYRYLTSDFAAFLAKRMIESKNIKPILESIYPDMLEMNWAHQINDRSQT
jgi:hypothetical protein